MKVKYVILVVILLISHNLYSQNKETILDSHHSHHHNEIGIGNAPYYFIKEKELAYGLHIHYIRIIGETKFGTGIGYERIFDDHKHNTFTFIGSYIPVEDFTLSLSPGFVFEDSDAAAINFALHFEVTYEFDFYHFHIGPTIEFSYDPEDYH